MSADWIKALRFAALPGAVAIVYERRHALEDGTPTLKHKLTSFSATGAVIGDDRDYDLLKAAMTPLENLAAAQDHNDLTVQLDLETGQLQGLTQG
jgi:hypothetical protein